MDLKDRVIAPSSPRMMTKPQPRLKYPWHNLKIGESFPIDHSEIKKDTLTSMAYRTGKRLGKRFKVVDHGPDAGYEVGFIGLREKDTKEEVKPTIGWNADLNKAVDK